MPTQKHKPKAAHVATALTAMLALAALATLLAACASAPTERLPDAMAVAPGEQWVTTLTARGVQIYACRAGSGGPAWAFVAPEATLHDAAGRSAGLHGPGPYWQAADGSRIVGTVLARVDAPVAGAIPWLLLRTRDDGPPGQLGGVTAVRRLHTSGGVAPATGCDASTLGAEARVPYTADYWFHRSVPAVIISGSAQ